MRFTAFLRAAAGAVIASSVAAGSVFADEPVITGPYIHDNLAVYLVHGASAAGPVPLTLQEAIAKDAVRVIETGAVNQLEIENTGTEDVFIQAGDIVKGGKQDRVLTISMLLTPGTGKVGIGAFCVEQGRWAARGSEDVKRFASANAAIPSREAKLAMLLPAKPSPAPDAGGITGIATAPNPASPPLTTGIVQQRHGYASGDDTSTRQREVWAKVKSTQDKLSGNLGGAVAAAQSQSSLQLSLENDRLKQAQKTYVAALQPAAEKDSDVVGFITAVNGKLASADIYPSNGLFRKMWAKQLNASVTEAIGEKSGPSVVPASGRGEPQAAPSIETVRAFLSSSDEGKAGERLIAGQMKLHTRETERSLLVEASRADGRFVHRNYLAK